MGNWCPIIKEDCNPECVFYRKYFRYYEKEPKKPELFEECAINMMADFAENQLNRTLALQKEVNVLRNQLSDTIKKVIAVRDFREQIQLEVEKAAEEKAKQLIDTREEVIDMVEEEEE